MNCPATFWFWHDFSNLFGNLLVIIAASIIALEVWMLIRRMKK